LLFHAGDTGYVPTLYSQIERIYGRGCELALMPIGSYAPRWHLRQQHCDPADVIKMHMELGAKRTLGVHYATWILSDEGYLEPKNEVVSEAALNQVEGEVIPGEMGRTIVIPWRRGFVAEEDELKDGVKGFAETREGKCVVWR
jgi:N-acyl-phosphatidylethanolamine-hydrolysing phospholipase D